MTHRLFSTMKFITFLTAVSLAMLGTFAFALSDGRHALGLFAAATVSLLLQSVVRDYAPRRPRWEPRGPARRFTPRAAAPVPLKLAA